VPEDENQSVEKDRITMKLKMLFVFGESSEVEETDKATAYYLGWK